MTNRAYVFCPLCAASLETRDVNGEVRKLCSAGCGFVHYDNPVPVVAAIVQHEGKIVLAHNRSWPGRFHGLITGFLERNESPEQCAVREVKEELNLDASDPRLVGIYSFPYMNQIILAYHVTATGTIRLNEELDDYKCLLPNECMAWPMGTGFALRDWLRTQGIEPQMLELPARR
jgi:NAD+ diphosphatase